MGQVGLPRSGARVFEGFVSDLARSGHEVYQDVWLTMDVLEYMKVIQKDKGDISALQYFRDTIYSKYLTDEEFRKCTGNNRRKMQNPRTSRGYTQKRNGTNVVAKSEQIYWV